MRINVQLVDASTGNQVWAQHYDKQLRDVFAVQNEIVQSLVTTLNLQFAALEQGFVLPQHTNNLEAYDYLLRGFECLLNVNPHDGFANARKNFEKALELDPGYADADGLLALTYFVGYLWQWDRDAGALDRADELANKSIALDDSEAAAYAVRGFIGKQEGRPNQAIADGERAVALDPNSAFNCQALSEISTTFGNPKEGLVYAHKAMRLDPRHRETYGVQEGWAYIQMGRLLGGGRCFEKSSKKQSLGPFGVSLRLFRTGPRAGSAS